MDVVLGALLIQRAIVDVELLELVPISQRPSCDVDMVFGVFVHSEHQRLARIQQRAAYLDTITYFFYIELTFYYTNILQ